MPAPINPSNLLVNIGSLRGILALHRADSSLTQSIRNLSSGIRIHTGRDDPIGFIASTAMKTEITNLSQAVANCQRADSILATVDSALGNINSLLTELRGLITEAASTGGETKETLAALQIQADAIIETINFISASTSFQKQKLLDGSLDFSTYGLESDKISLLQINQANFQGRTEKDIVVQVHEPARQAELYYPYGVMKQDTIFTIGGTGGYSSFSYDRDATVQDVADAVNRISDSTGIAATVFSKSNAGSIMLTSYGKDNDVLVTASEPGTMAGNFVFRYTALREGNAEAYMNVAQGDGNNPTVVEIILQTEPGGNVLTTAEQVVTLINTSPFLKNPDGTGRLTAALPTGTMGLGTVTPFAEVGYYGSVNENNYLQFLAPAGSPPIKFISTPGTPLSVDDTTCPPVYGNAAAQVQGFDAGTSFTLRSLLSGPEGDNVKIIFRDSAEESAVYDPISKSVIFSVDFSGRDATGNFFSMEDLKKLVADNHDVDSRFRIIPHASYSPDNPLVFSSPHYLGIDAQMGATTGGVISPGSLVINLETDENGLIRTTANDLVKFFNNPSTEESAAVLKRYGISVACIDPTNTILTACTIGEASFGTGLLSPTYNPCSPCPPDKGFPDVYFCSYGNNIREENATATILSEGGRNADWTLTARNTGAAFNNVSIRITEDITGPSVQYNSLLKTFTVSIGRENPSTASEIVALINDDPEISVLFAASLPDYSNGEGTVRSTDKAVLTGGVQPLYARPEGTVIASGGIHSMFTVVAKRADERYNNTEILVVADPLGPSVSYHVQSKQLTIGVDPSKVPPATASDIVGLINNTPEIRDIFSASIPLFIEGTSIVPNGSGAVLVGDSGMLRTTATGATMGAAMIGATDNQSLGILFHSVEYGSSQFVDLWATNGTEFPVVDRFGNLVEKAWGTDIAADINGRRAIGEGRIAMSTTSDLDVAITTDPSVLAGDVFGFRISGGGALMQLGPTATWSQQVRVSIPSVHSTALGGESGTLSQLKTDEPFSLLNDSHRAFRILEETEIQITTLRSRLGSLQRSRVEASLDHMTDAINIETEARSNIADTEFATESSEFARQQLLMQASISVLQQSGQTKQLLLSLLQR